VVQQEKGTPVPRNSRKGQNEGSMDKVKGRAKEAAGSLRGNKDLQSEGRTDQYKCILKKKGATKDLLG